MYRTIFCAAVLILLSGCSSISKEECLYADWQAIGYEDGAAGRPVSAISNRRTVCAKKAQVTVDMAAYIRGRDDGLVEYCQPSNGYSYGTRGGVYNGVCSGPDEDEFLLAYETGRRLFTLERDVQVINADIRQAHADLHRTEDAIASAEIALISPGHPPAERLQILADLKQFSEQKGSIQTALIALNRDQLRAEDALNAYRDELAYNGGWRGVAGLQNAKY